MREAGRKSPAVVLAAIAIAGVMTATAQASHGTNGFSGTWTTNLGSVSFSAVDAASGAQELQTLGGTACGAPATYYRGEYSDGSGTGRMVACTQSGEDLAGRYRNDDQSLSFPGGDFAISLVSPSSFSGFYTADDPSFPGQFPYTGTFASHFPGDGCCPDDEPPPGGGSLEPPSNFCGIGDDPARHAAAETPARCVKRTILDPEAKRQARKQLREDLKVTILVCGQYAASVEAGSPYAVGFIPICIGAVKLMSATLAIVNDPPDPRYDRIVGPHARGAGRLSSGRCSPKALCKALKGYRAPASGAAYTAHSLALTANRSSAAVAANSPAEAFLQGAVGKVWAGELAKDLGAQEAAGRRLAKQLGREGVKISFDGKETKQIASEIARKRASKQVLKRLIATGLASNMAEARAVLEAALKTVKGPVGTKALTGSLPASAFASDYRSMMMSELAAIVNAFAAEGDLSASAQGALINDLEAAQAACGRPEERVAALDRFVARARAEAAREVASFLAFGAKPLKATTLPSSSCT